ncbi:MAG TPA: hypothetical protein VGP93_03005, partial [Polyangiaceae bacterium]|nr:hypothetical protein [Polyangiaceae bacterium]
MPKLSSGWILAFSISCAACSASVDSGAGGSDAGGGGGSSGGTTTTGGASSAGTSGKGGAAGSGASGGTGPQGGSAGSAASAGSGGSSGASGSSGTTGTGGVGGALTDYDPCPDQGTPCAIMPFGDSLTQGDHGDNTADGGYRPFLFHLALAQSQAITFVGQGSNGPDTV